MRQRSFASPLAAALVVGMGVLSVYGCSGSDRTAIAPASDGGTASFSDSGAVEQTDADDSLIECAAKELKAEPAKVDLIFIVDASGSMSEELVQTQQNINAFAQTIGKSGLDYKDQTLD